MKNNILLTILTLLATHAVYAMDLSTTGHAEGAFAVILEPQAVVKAKLPKKLKMDPRLVTTNGLYPIIMFLGKQTDLTSQTPLGQTVIEKEYLEATYSIVVIGPDNRHYSFTSNLIVNSVPSLLLGRLIGYPKKLRHITISEAQFGAKKSDNLTVSVLAQFKDVSDYNQSELMTNFRSLFTNVPPSVSFNQFQYNCFDFKWNFDETTIRPIKSQIKLGEDFTEAGNRNYTSPGLNETAYGSFKFTASWKITNLRKCDF